MYVFPTCTTVKYIFVCTESSTFILLLYQYSISLSGRILQGYYKNCTYPLGTILIDIDRETIENGSESVFHIGHHVIALDQVQNKTIKVDVILSTKKRNKDVLIFLFG